MPHGGLARGARSTRARALLFAALPALPLAASPAASAQARVAQPPPADSARTLPMDPQVTVGTLPNGLRYYIRANEKPEKRAELRLVVNAGSVLEDDDQRGLAHFVEHMAFNGTRHFEKQKLVDYVESIGMQFGPHVNAGTGFDETLYMLRVPTDSAAVMATAFQILEDWAHGQTFDPTEVDKERGVVIEEWRLGRGAGARIADQQLPVLFKSSRYAERLPIGTRSSLESFRPEALARFYRDWYRPDLMAVVAVGDFDVGEIERRIRTHFGRIPRPASARPRTVFPVPDHDSTLIAVATDREETSSVVSVLYKHPAREQASLAAYRLRLVERLYNGMLNRRLGELVQTQADPPFVGAFSGRGSFVRSKEIYSLGAVVKDGGIERGLEALLTEAERVDEHGFTQSELDRQKQDVMRGMERAYAERDKTESDAYADEYVRAFLEGEPAPGIAYEYELYRRLLPGITLEEINRVGRDWITDRNRVILVSAPEKEGLRVPGERELLAVFDAVGRKQIAAYDDAVTDAPLLATVPAPAPIVSERAIPEVGVTELRLANGVRVVLKPTDFKADQVLMSAWSPGGSSLAPDSLFITSLVADEVVIAGGVGAFSSVALRKALAGKAVNVGPQIGDLEEGFSGLASPRDLETLFQLVYLYFTAPRLDSTAVASLTSRLRSQLENRDASPDAAFVDTLTVTLAQYHPRARPFTAERVAEIDMGRSLAFYKDRFADASDFTFYFVGSFTVDGIRPHVQRYLGALPATKRAERWRDVGITPPRGVIEKTVRRGVEPKARTHLVFTGPFEFTRENRYALTSMAEVLRIKLREQLREEQGGTYGVSVSAGARRDPRPQYEISISFGAAPERLEELTRIVFQQIDSLKASGATTQDLDKVKETQRRGRETSLKENDYWLSQLASADRLGREYREILTYERLIAGLTSDAIKQAARRYFDSKNYVRVSLVPESFQPATP